MSDLINNHESFDENVQSDKLKLLYHQSFPAIFFSLIAASIYVGILWPKMDSKLLFIWLSVIVISSFLRLFLFLTYRHKNPQGDEVLKWERPYFITLMISSSIWGIGAVLLSYNLSFLYQTITYFILMGMAGSALTVYSAIRYFSVSAVAIILLPITLWFLFLADSRSIMMSALGIIFMVSAYRATLVLSDTLHFSYMLTHALGRAKEEAEKLASIDMLTGINNRRAFTELAKNQVEYCKRHEYPVSAIILDADHFKNINDTYGHASGDAALQNLSNILQNLTRASDVIGRIGGEEFAVLLTSTNVKDAMLVAEKLKNWIADNPVHIDDEYFSMTVSIGVASDDKYNLELLLNNADKAMYKAKRAGRNQVICF
ncbi:MAG: diguanylate cyclase [Gammaproteobacteria bacterium]|nr:diguanylate cyclase [Gammaproteobacteria bacterium]